MAIFSLVPTPSVAETRIGSIKPAFFRSKTPPKLPTFPATPGMFVFLTFGLIKETNLFPSSISTPDYLYLDILIYFAYEYVLY